MTIHSSSSAPKEIKLRASVELGILPTHEGFVAALVPDEGGRLPRNDEGEFVVVDISRKVAERSPVAVDSVQISVFPGTLPEEWDAMIGRFREVGIGVHLVMMVGGVDPMNPADEDAVIGQLLPALEAAKRHGIETVSSTSVEEWMQEGAVRKEGEDFEKAIEQVIRLHKRAYEEAELAGSCVKAWHVEFLGPGEFQTFTDLGRLWAFIRGINERLGENFFRCLIDPAHCGDSSLSLPENQKLIADIAAGGGLGIMHASAPTTRGCLSTDDGWVGGILLAAAQTGKFEQLFVEVFHHEDEALAPLRELGAGHGVDTRDGRDYTQVVADGLGLEARRLNNFVARGIMPGSA